LSYDRNAPHTSSEGNKEYVDIAVNGTLMRGLELEPNLINLGARFVCDSYTEPMYRLFSIDDIHPGMIRLPASGLEKMIPVSVAVEIWSVPASGIATLLGKEPPGLSIGKIKLTDGSTEVLGVLAETALIAGKRDISDFPGGGKANFRDYIVQEGMRIIDDALDQATILTAHQITTVKKFRAAAGLLRQDGKSREAIDLLNYCVKELGLASRLFQNMPLGSIESFHLVRNTATSNKEFSK